VDVKTGASSWTQKNASQKIADRQQNKNRNREGFRWHPVLASTGQRLFNIMAGWGGSVDVVGAAGLESEEKGPSRGR
jgi:hypothetical protein